MPLTFAALLLTAFVAPATPGPNVQLLPRLVQATPPERRTVTFTCRDGTNLVAEFVTSDPSAPALVRPTGNPAVSLPAQASGSGFLYSDGTRELRGKGREVTWTDGQRPPVTCTASPSSVDG